MSYSFLSLPTICRKQTLYSYLLLYKRYPIGSTTKAKGVIASILKGPFCLRAIHLWNSLFTNKGQNEMEMKVWAAILNHQKFRRGYIYIHTREDIFQGYTEIPSVKLRDEINFEQRVICVAMIGIIANCILERSQEARGNLACKKIIKCFIYFLFAFHLIY